MWREWKVFFIVLKKLEEKYEFFMTKIDFRNLKTIGAKAILIFLSLTSLSIKNFLLLYYKGLLCQI